MKALFFLFICIFVISNISWPQDKAGSKDNKERIIYKYKKYQKFDFEDLMIEGETGAPGDLSINPRFQKEFRNKLPYRKNFNPELHRSVERIR